MAGPKAIRPSEMEWKDQPALPPGVKHADLIGSRTAPGTLVFRIRSAPGLRVLPHSHPEDRVYTVISGKFQIGYGERFDAKSLQSLEEGSVVLVPGGQHHFQLADEHGYTIQINALGPTSTDYARPEDDPRRTKSV